SRKNSHEASGLLYQSKLYEAPNITAVDPDFDWEQEEEVKYRPMKNGTYKMTMAIRRLEAEDHFIIDKKYLIKTNVRATLLEENRDQVVFCEAVCHPAIREWYDYVVDFLVKRYPMIFHEKSEGVVYNQIREESFPKKSNSVDDVIDLLSILGRNIEDDFVILLKNEKDEEYILRGGNFLFPAGFNPKKLLGSPLTSIHLPVPQYTEKLQLAMNKFFNRINSSQYVVRNNWSIQTHDKIHDLGLNHGKPGQDISKIEKLKPEFLDFNKVFLRSERQVLTRLPKTKAVVMSIKTYFTPLIKLREEENMSEVLCNAIDGLPDDLAIYKNKIKWGEAVKAYMKR
ncbi:hypothetical protein PACTADRAFT_20862, partial [Pachysolen tannophilus NRRL Y-2460]